MSTAHVVNSKINVLSLCSGIAGLDGGLDIALDGRCRVVGYVEREASAAAILLARMEQADLEPAPVWCGDIHDFDGLSARGVDVVTGGYPCQPFSFAGKRRGADDPRHLWPAIARIIAESMPGICFFENVAGHLGLGFDAVRNDLRAMGYRVTAGLFTAEEVGATHKRERLFILAVREGGRFGVGGESSRRDGFADGGDARLADSIGLCGADAQAGERYGAGESSGGTGQRLVHSGSDGRRLDEQERGSDRGAAAGWSGEAVGDTASARYDQAGSRQQEQPKGRQCVLGNGRVGLADAEISRHERAEPAGSERANGRAAEHGRIPIFPPGPSDFAGWSRVLAEMPQVEPAVCRVSSRLSDRLDRLRALGNAVVPLEAAYAFVSLWACLREE